MIEDTAAVEDAILVVAVEGVTVADEAVDSEVHREEEGGLQVAAFDRSIGAVKIYDLSKRTSIANTRQYRVAASLRSMHGINKIKS